LPRGAFVNFLQNHDQIGNRPIGERLSVLANPAALEAALAVLLLQPSPPMLFMGEEWGATTPFQFFTSHTDPVIGAATATGRKAEFAEHGWDSDDVPDPQDSETFLRSKLIWSEVDDARHSRLLACYRDLIALRRARAELTDPWLTHVFVEYDEDARWIIVHRGSLTVLYNLSADAVTVPATGIPLLFWDAPEVSESRAKTTIPGHSFAVLEVEQGDEY
jgi:maltooligosyltrehalose trehalohydrolase